MLHVLRRLPRAVIVSQVSVVSQRLSFSRPKFASSNCVNARFTHQSPTPRNDKHESGKRAYIDNDGNDANPSSFATEYGWRRQTGVAIACIGIGALASLFVGVRNTFSQVPSEQDQSVSMESIFVGSPKDVTLAEYYGISDRRNVKVIETLERFGSGEDIFVICGPQGVGKSEMMKRLLKKRRFGCYVPLRMADGDSGCCDGAAVASDGASDTILRRIGYIPTVRNGVEDFSHFVAPLTSALKHFKSKYRQKPLIIIDDLQAALIDGTNFSQRVSSLLTNFLVLQSQGYADFVFVLSDDRAIAPLQTRMSACMSTIRLICQVSGGGDGFRVHKVTWWPAEELVTPAAKFLGVSETSSRMVLDAFGGNLMDLRRVRDLLYPQEAKPTPISGEEILQSSVHHYIDYFSSFMGIEERRGNLSDYSSQPQPVNPISLAPRPDAEIDARVPGIIAELQHRTQIELDRKLKSIPASLFGPCVAVLRSVDQLLRNNATYSSYSHDRRLSGKFTPEQIQAAEQWLLYHRILWLDHENNFDWYKQSVGPALVRTSVLPLR